MPISLNFKQRLQFGYAKPKRNRAYLDWVKTLPCSKCNCEGTEPHHIIAAGLGGGMGTKADDYLSMPLCRKCHDELHDGIKDMHSQWEWVAMTLLQAIHEGVIE